MDTLRYDLRHAVRLMFRQPGTTAIILLTLALAIGANTAVFSAVHAVLLKPLPYAEPDTLVMVCEKRAAEKVFDNRVSPADFLDWARLNQSFSAIAAYSETSVDLTGEGDPERLPAAGVTPAYFDVFGVRAAARPHLRGRRRPGRAQSRRRALARGVAAAIWRRPGGGRPIDRAQRHSQPGDRRPAAGPRVPTSEKR